MKAILLASAASLALVSGAYAVTPPTAHAPMSIKAPNMTNMHVVPQTGSSTLYSQSGSTASSWPASNDITTTESAAVTSAGADSFVLPKGKHSISAVYAPGESYGYFGDSYPNAMDVTFYSKIKTSKKGSKAKVLFACTDMPYTNEGGYGDFLTDLKTCKGAKKLTGGKEYWVSIQAVDDYHDGYQYWFWMSRKTDNGPSGEGDWENPSGYFGACSTFAAMDTCFGSDDSYVGNGFEFTLYGK